MNKAYIIGILLLLSVVKLHAQEQCRWITVNSAAQQLDSLSVLDSSIKIPMDTASLIIIQYNYLDGSIKLTSSHFKDSVLVCYRSIPLSFHSSTQFHSIAEYDSGMLFKSFRSPNAIDFSKKDELFATDNISKTGSLSRGISFGNTQNVFVNSNFNLQMEGKLTDNLNLRAAISDQNIPYQPEGNSQRLQDFDNVFVQVYNSRFSLTAGDIILRNPTSHYLRYYKNVQGLQGNYQYQVGENIEASSALGVSIAKGRFASIQLEVEEGISGPYRLRGAENERFIIVIANSERVFIDGQALERGFDSDYVMDYNTGEITFTPQILITKYSRVRVDFEYAVQNYARSIIAFNQQLKIKKTETYFNWYQERDNPNRPLLYNLNDEQKFILSQAGDLTGTVPFFAIDSALFDPDRILYRKVDTLDLTGNRVEAFVYSTDSTQAFYRLNFTELGAGNGNYILKSSLVNGRVYEWVSPISGIPQGNFEPVVLVSAPEQRQLFNLGTKISITKNDILEIEMAASDHDRNLYSDIDSESNQGTSVRVAYTKTGLQVGNYKYTSKLETEWLSSNFKPIDRFRSIDFDRDWNLPLQTGAHQEYIITWQNQLQKDVYNAFNYTLTRRDRSEQLSGWRQQALIKKSVGAWHNVIQLGLLNAQQSTFYTQWSTVSYDTQWRFKKATTGYTFLREQNLNYTPSDSAVFVPNAFQFQENRWYVQSADSLKSQFLFDFAIREDQAPVAGEYQPADHAQTTRLQWKSAPGNQQWGVQLIYRTLENKLDSLQNTEETIMARIDWNAAWWQRAVRTEFTFALANGRELRREYVYVQVPTGEGTHTWVDENENGIRELNEFYEAITFDQRNYIRLFTPTDQYINAFTQLLNYRVHLEAPRAWRSRDGLAGMVSRFSNTSFFSIDRKLSDERLSARISPFASIADTSLLSNRSAIRSSTFFNKTGTRFGADFTYARMQSRQVLVAGFEERTTEEWRVNPRINLNAAWSMRLESARLNRTSNSDFLSGRNFIIAEQKISPELSWQPRQDFRLNMRYNYNQKQNTSEGNEQARFHEAQIESRWVKAGNATMNTWLRFSNIAYTGALNNAVAFEMLEALRPGNNLSWNINWMQRLANGLQLSLVYEGRKSENTPIINTGRMQLTALF